MWSRETDKYILDSNGDRINTINEIIDTLRSDITCVNPEHDNLINQNKKLRNETERLSCMLELSENLRHQAEAEIKILEKQNEQLQERYNSLTKQANRDECYDCEYKMKYNWRNEL